MPETTPISRADIAIASSAAGTFLKSTGPSTVPVLTTLVQSDVTNLPGDLAAKAPVVSPVFSGLAIFGGQAAGTGPNRWDLQTSFGVSLARFTNFGTLLHDLTVNTSGITNSVQPGGTPPPFTFNQATGSFANTGGNAYDNTVWQSGWNTGPAGNQINLLYPTFRIACESNFWTGAEQWMEGHDFAYVPPGVGTETRPYSVVVNKSNNYDTYAIFQGSSWTWANRGQTLQIASLARDSSENVTWKVPGKGNQDGTDGYALTLISASSPALDTLTLGRNSASGTTLTLNASSQTALMLNGGVGRASIGAGATILTMIAPAAGGFLQERSDNYQLLNWAASRFIIRAGDNGTSPQIGFLGAAPVSRLTFGSATAGASYDATSQAMLQKCYDGFRTLGFGT